jgi:hypothetical protein
LRIAVFDYFLTRNNPIGSCHLAMLRALATEHDFTVFAVEFENPWPQKIRWVRVPAPKRPLALLFVVYHLMAPLCYLLYRLRGAKFDLVQALESNLVFADIIGASPAPGDCAVGSDGSIISFTRGWKALPILGRSRW